MSLVHGFSLIFNHKWSIITLYVISFGKRREECMGNFENQHTQDVNLEREYTIEVSDIISEVYEALSEKGYNPVNQIVGYIMSGDPTYITSYKGARSLIMKAERDEILELLMENYIETRLK